MKQSISRRLRHSLRCVLPALLSWPFAFPLHATPVFEPVKSFVLGSNYSSSKLLEASDGNFYGMIGGTVSSDSGQIYKLTPEGVITTIIEFDGTNGSNPLSELIEASDGNFYGTTHGGTHSSDYGTVFKLTPDGTLTTLVHFNWSNGALPFAGLIEASDGNFYGTTQFGGFNDNGTVFKVSPDGNMTTLVHFDWINGGRPVAGLIEASDGNLYGTTAGGGNSFFGYGTAFRLTPDGTLTTLVHFDGSNGVHPQAELIEASDGNFYGTTNQGGGGDGTIFRLTKNGTLTTLVNFNKSNGTYPNELFQASDGNLYGTTYYGGASDSGTVFQMTLDGMLTTLVDFDRSNGNWPASGLLQASDGNLYGTARRGGIDAEGNPTVGARIYRLRMGPSVTSLPATDVTSQSATLNGMVNPGGYATTVSFQYGTDPTLSAYQSVDTVSLPVGTSDIAVQSTIVGLQSGVLYYFRVVASNAENVVPQNSTIISFITLGAQSKYASWASTHFTANQLADPLISGPNADPDEDDLPNILECAFNMPPLSAGNEIMASGTGTYGLPRISTLGSDHTTRLRIEYVRRKVGLDYTPQFSSDIGNDTLWFDAIGTETVQSIDSEWERVIIEDDTNGEPKRFGRVKVVSEE